MLNLGNKQKQATPSKQGSQNGQQTVVVNAPPERVLMDLPGSRQFLTQVSSPSHYEWVLSAPAGHEIDEMQLDLELTPTTTSTTTQLSALIKAMNFYSITTDSQGNQTQTPVGFADGASIGDLAIMSQALRERVRPSASPLNSTIVRDPKAGTTATAYYSNWRIHTPFDGTQFLVTLDLVSVVSVLVSATAVSASLSLIARWRPKTNSVKYTFLAQQQPSVPKIAYTGVYKCGLFLTTEWNANTSGVSLGGGMTAEQVIRNQVISNDDLFGLATAGSATTLDNLGIQDPHTAANTFVLIGRFGATPAQIRATFSATQTVVVVIFAKSDPSKLAIS